MALYDPTINLNFNQIGKNPYGIRKPKSFEKFANNQAMQLYTAGPYIPDPSQMTTSAWGMTPGIADYNTANMQGAIGAVQQGMNASNPYAQNYNQYYNWQNPYGQQIGTGFQPNQFLPQFGQNYQNPFISQVANSQSYNPYQTDISRAAGATNPYTGDVSQAGGYQNPYQSQIAGIYQDNPYTSMLNMSDANPLASDVVSAGGYQNPYMQQIAGGYQDNPYTSLLNMSDSNPYQQAFSDFNALQNESLEGAIDATDEDIRDQINSMFGGANRSMSAGHIGEMVKELGKNQSKMRLSARDADLGRQLQAMTTGAGLYDTSQARNLQATGMGIDAANVDQNRFLDYMQAAAGLGESGANRLLQAVGKGADLYDVGQARNLQATGMGIDAANIDQNRLLDITQAAAGLGESAADRQLAAATANLGAGGQDLSRALTGAGMGADTYAATQARMLDALVSSGQMSAEDANRYLQSITAGANVAADDRASQLDWLSQAAGLSQQDLQNQLGIFGDQANLYNTDQARALQAAGMMPGLNTAMWQSPLMLSQFGESQEALNKERANAYWDALAKYRSIIAGDEYAREAAKPSGLSQLAGLGMTAAGVAGGLGWAPFAAKPAAGLLS